MKGVDDDVFFRNPPSGKPKPTGIGLLGNPAIPPRHGQLDKYKIQAFAINKK
jgi:hypothetical protein